MIYLKKVLRESSSTLNLNDQSEIDSLFDPNQLAEVNIESDN